MCKLRVKAAVRSAYCELNDQVTNGKSSHRPSPSTDRAPRRNNEDTEDCEACTFDDGTERETHSLLQRNDNMRGKNYTMVKKGRLVFSVTGTSSVWHRSRGP